MAGGFAAAMQGGGAPRPVPPQAGGQPAPGPQPGPQPDMGGTEAASPEEQDAYDRFVGRALEFIYDKAFDKVLDMLRGGDDPIDGLAVTAATVVARIQDAAEQAGQKLSGDILLHAGSEILADLAGLATKARIHDFEQDPKQLETAWYRALDEYRVMRQSAGKLDQEVAKQDLASLQQADQDGELAAMMQRMEGRQGAVAAPGGQEPPMDGAEGGEEEGPAHEQDPGDAAEDAAEGEPPDTEDEMTGRAPDFPDEEAEKPAKKPMRR